MSRAPIEDARTQTPLDRPAVAIKWLIGIVLATLAIDLFFYTGYYASDDRHVLTAAYHLASGHFEFARTTSSSLFTAGGPHFDFGALRLVMTLPVAVIYYFSAGNYFLIVSYFIAYHLGSVILTYALGALLHDRATGLLAALLVGTSPLLFVFAGAILPDGGTLFWLLACVYLLFLLRFEPDWLEKPSRVVSRQSLLLLSAGACLGLSYAAKITGIIAVVPLAALIASTSDRFVGLETIRRGAFFSAGIAFVVLCETLILSSLFGEFINRVEIVAGLSDAHKDLAVRQGAQLGDRFVLIYDMIRVHYPLVSYWLLLGGSVSYVFFRQKELYLWLLFMWLVVFNVVGTTSLTTYAPPSLQPRYFSLVIPLAGIMFSFVFLDLARRLVATVGGGEHLAGLAPVLLVLAVVAPISVTSVPENVPRAARIFRSTAAATLLAAYRKGSTDYGGLPVTYSNASRQLLRAHLLKEAFVSGRSWSAVTLDSRSCSPPFLHVTAAVAGRDEVLDNCPQQLRDELDVSLLSVVPKQTRVEAISGLLRETFNPSVTPRTRGSLFAYVYVVRARSDRSEPRISSIYSSRGVAIPMFQRNRKGSVLSYTPGDRPIVSWPAGRNENEEPIRLTSFDNRYYKNTPINDFASFPSADHGLAFELTLSKPSPASLVDLEVYLWLYTEGEFLALYQKRVSSWSGEPTKTVRIETEPSAAGAARHFRFGIHVEPLNESAGELVVDGVSLDALAPVGDDEATLAL